MVWKSREDKLPPPSYFSLIAAHLQQAYRGAHISRELMQTLRPYFIEAWRNGKSAEAAAQTTCSCDGHAVVPSPVVNVHIAKGTVRPPQGAQRGEVFGADELRAPAPVERLQRKLQRIEEKKKKEQAVGARWAERAGRARSKVQAGEAVRKTVDSDSRYNALQAEAARVGAEFERLRGDLQRAAKKTAPASIVATPPPTAAPVPAKTAPASTVSAQPGAAPSTPARRRPKSPPTPTPAPAPSQDGALLSAIRSLLPDVANQLATEMKKEGEKK